MTRSLACNPARSSPTRHPCRALASIKVYKRGRSSLMRGGRAQPPNNLLQQTAALLSVSQGILPSRPPLLSFGVRQRGRLCGGRRIGRTGLSGCLLPPLGSRAGHRDLAHSQSAANRGPFGSPGSHHCPLHRRVVVRHSGAAAGHTVHYVVGEQLFRRVAFRNSPPERGSGPSRLRSDGGRSNSRLWPDRGGESGRNSQDRGRGIGRPSLFEC